MLYNCIEIQTALYSAAATTALAVAIGGIYYLYGECKNSGEEENEEIQKPTREIVIPIRRDTMKGVLSQFTQYVDTFYEEPNEMIDNMIDWMRRHGHPNYADLCIVREYLQDIREEDTAEYQYSLVWLRNAVVVWQENPADSMVVWNPLPKLRTVRSQSFS